MPRRIRSVNQAGYVELIDIDEQQLEAVVAMLEISNEAELNEARHRIYSSLEDLKTRRSRSIPAKLLSEDRAALQELAKLANSHWLSERIGPLLDQFESLRSDNPVLFRRLEVIFGGAELHAQIAQLELAYHFLAGFGQELERAGSLLCDEFESEDGRGRRPEYADRAFASSLYKIWVEFTGRGTSRQNASDRAKHPFGDFVDAAGKLIDPEFKGHDHARKVHEAARA